MTNPTIPVPVYVLRKLIDHVYRGYSGEEQCIFCWEYEDGKHHTDDCPIPTLREAVKESEENQS